MTVARKSFSGTAVPSSINGGITNVATTLVLNTTTGWPDGTNGRTPAKIDPGLATEEDITYLTRAGSNVTGVLRGQNGTAASAHSNGAVIIHGWSAGEADEVYQHMSDTEADPHSAKLLNTTRHDLTSRHTAGTVIPTAAPTSSAPGDASATGAGPNLANAQHKHARESWGLVGDIAASAPSDTALAGATGKVADAGHRHAREAPSGGGTPSFPASTSYTVTPANLTIGNGAILGRYIQAGKMVFIEVYLQWGTTTSSSGTWNFNLPPGMVAAFNQVLHAMVNVVNGTNLFLPATAQINISGNNFAVFSPSNSQIHGQTLSGTWPGVWASNDSMMFSGWIEIA